MREQWIIKANVRCHGASEIARKQDRSDHRRLWDRVQDGTNEQNDA